MNDIDYIKVSRLKEWYNFDFCWNNIQVSLKDIEKHMKSKNIVHNLNRCDLYIDVWNKQDHLNRVAYFIENPKTITPINIDNKCIGLNILPQPLIMDGHHRFMAVLYRKDDVIPAHYSGLVYVLDYLTGKSDEKP